MKLRLMRSHCASTHWIYGMHGNNRTSINLKRVPLSPFTSSWLLFYGLDPDSEAEVVILVTKVLYEQFEDTNCVIRSHYKIWVRNPLMTRYTVYNIVIKIVSDLRQVVGFILVRIFPPQIKLTGAMQLKYSWKWL